MTPSHARFLLLALLVLCGVLGVAADSHGATMAAATTAEVLCLHGEGSLREAESSAIHDELPSDCTVGENPPIVEGIERPPGIDSKIPGSANRSARTSDPVGFPCSPFFGARSRLDPRSRATSARRISVRARSMSEFVGSLRKESRYRRFELF